MYFIGYAPNNKGYVTYNPVSKVRSVSCNLQFMETQHPPENIEQPRREEPVTATVPFISVSGGQMFGKQQLEEQNEIPEDNQEMQNVQEEQEDPIGTLH